MEKPKLILQKPNPIPAVGTGFLLGLAVPLILVIILIFSGSEGRRFVNEGKEVTATITHVNGSDVTVEYITSAGKKQVAKSTVKKDVKAGDKLTVYVLESDPTTYYYPMENKFKYIFYGLIVVIAIVGWIPLIKYFKKKKEYELLLKSRALAYEEGKAKAADKSDPNNDKPKKKNQNPTFTLPM